MHQTEKIIRQILVDNAGLFQEEPFEEMYYKDTEAIITCMKEIYNLAIDTALKEAAENATIKHDTERINHYLAKGIIVVDKSSILNLSEKLKIK